MLKLSLNSGEYINIGGNIIVQVYRVAGDRTYLAIEAPREVPVVRGSVLEREGEARPKNLLPAYKDRKREKAILKVSTGSADRSE